MFGDWFPLPMFHAAPNGAKADQLNQWQFMEVFNRITNVALSRFHWKNLPDTCNERALEMTLYFYGKALFFDDPDKGFMHTPVTLNGPFNVYYESITRRAYSFDYEHEYTIDNSVVIRDNITMTPSYLQPWIYAPKIADALRSIDVHTQTLKRPFIVSCQEKQTESVKTAFRKISDNEPIVIGSKDMADTQKLAVLNTNVPCVLSDMWSNVKNYYQQVYTSLGVENRFQEKKERMVSSEASGETNVTRHVLESALSMREKACEEINAMFGLNISVEVNQIDRFPLEAGELFDNEYEQVDEDNPRVNFNEGE